MKRRRRIRRKNAREDAFYPEDQQAKVLAGGRRKGYALKDGCEYGDGEATKEEEYTEDLYWRHGWCRHLGSFPPRRGRAHVPSRHIAVRGHSDAQGARPNGSRKPRALLQLPACHQCYPDITGFLTNTSPKQSGLSLACHSLPLLHSLSDSACHRTFLPRRESAFMSPVTTLSAVVSCHSSSSSVDRF